MVIGEPSPSTLAQASSSNWAFGGMAGNRLYNHTDNPTTHNATTIAKILSNICLLPSLQVPLSMYKKVREDHDDYITKRLFFCYNNLLR